MAQANLKPELRKIIDSLSYEELETLAAERLAQKMMIEDVDEKLESTKQELDDIRARYGLPPFFTQKEH